MGKTTIITSTITTFTIALGFAFEQARDNEHALQWYDRAAGSSSSGYSTATRAIAAAAHTGLGWVKLQQQQQQQPDEQMRKQKEKVFQVAHVHFLTSLKLIGGSAADAANTAGCSAAFKLPLRLYRGLVTSLWQSR
jgi:hypothetical protein